MATTFVSTNTIGAGIQFTFAASGDALVVLPGVTIGSTNGTVINPNGFSDHEVTVLGTMVSFFQVNLPTNSSFAVGTGGTFLNMQASSLSAGLFMNGANSTAQIDGTFSSPEAIALLSGGGANTVTVTGRVSGASGAFLGLNGASGDILVNSGSITASTVDDAVRTTRFNNGVFAEGTNTRITNLAGGEITGTATEGAGVRLGFGSNGSSVVNHGTITSVQWAGVDFAGISSGETATLFNTGLIAGLSTAFTAVGAGGDVAVTNLGHMIGSVSLGNGSDVFDGRGGRLDGIWTGNAGADRYDGRGATVISGPVFGGTGNDTLLGGDGAETIHGDGNADLIRGGGGDDLLFGGIDSDVMYGDDGRDEMYGGDGAEQMHGGAGNDVINGEEGGLVAYGGDGDDELSVDAGGSGQFTLGYGGAGNDLFFGGLAQDVIYGGAGDDEVYANLGDDLVYGGAGDDTIDAFDGNDTVYGGTGDDTILNATGEASLFGGTGLDTMSGGAGADMLDGGQDADHLTGGGGNDTLIGGEDNDTLLGDESNDRLVGGSGDDLLDGGAQKDTMFGNGGSDTLVGGSSADTMTGGQGSDIFDFDFASHIGTALGNRDVITDFRSGTDQIDLADIDANTGLAGNQAFSFIGAAAFSSVAGQLRYSSGDGLLQGDADGNGVADFVLELSSLPGIVAADILL